MLLSDISLSGCLIIPFQPHVIFLRIFLWQKILRYNGLLSRTLTENANSPKRDLSVCANIVVYYHIGLCATVSDIFGLTHRKSGFHWKAWTKWGRKSKNLDSLLWLLPTVVPPFLTVLKNVVDASCICEKWSITWIWIDFIWGLSATLSVQGALSK